VPHQHFSTLSNQLKFNWVYVYAGLILFSEVRLIFIRLDCVEASV